MIPLLFSLFTSLLLLLSPTVQADSLPSGAPSEAVVSLEKASDQILGNLRAAELQYAETELDVSNANLSLAQVQQVIDNTQKNIETYQEQQQELVFFNPSKATQAHRAELAAKIASQQAVLAMNQQRQQVLLKTLTVLNAQLQKEKKQVADLRSSLKQQQKWIQHINIEKQAAELNSQQNYWLNKIVSLNQSIDAVLKKPQADVSDAYQELVKQLFIAQENSNLLQIDINLTHDKNQLLSLQADEVDETLSVTGLNQQRKNLDDLSDQLNQTLQLINNKADLLKQRQKISEHQDAATTTLISQIVGRYQAYGDTVQELQQAITDQKLRNTERLAKALARRQGLPGFSLFEWYSLGQGLVQMEVMGSQALIGLAKDIGSNFLHISWFKLVKLVLSFLVLSFCSYSLSRLLRKKLKTYRVTATDFKTRFFIGITRIVRAHLYVLAGFAWFLVLLKELTIGEQWLRLSFHLLSTYIVFSVALSAARVGLYENLSSNKGDDVKLYFRLLWTLVFGAIVTVCLVLSRQLNVMYEIHDFFNRVFALFVLILASMLLKAWQVVPQLIIPHVNVKHYYLIRVIKLLGALIPLIILSNALTAIIGYVDLAWTISKCEGVFVFFAIVYLIAKGMLNELLTWLADLFISRFRSGWLLTEAVLKPVSKWVHVVVFLLFAYLLLYTYGITEQVFFTEMYYRIMHFTLIRFSTTNITLWVLIKATLVAMVFVWAVHWSREFCYRRLYLGVKDIGARNSLAIFTQYGMVLIGVLVTLKVLQIDLTVLALVFSGFAIGIGFGLRDLANNFACGLLLLIERPMRRGDTVTIGTHEGVVVNIGMRAITLISSENGEVVVPNSEAFSKIFINWTRQDDVVRCEVIIKASREENPNYLSEVIMEAVVATEGVLTKPAPAVLLKSLHDTVLEFEVRFHINYRIHDSRTQMKSRVLFNIWQSFESLGVKPPYPQQDIRIKELPLPSI